MKRKITKIPYYLCGFDIHFLKKIDYYTFIKINDECIDIVNQEVVETSNNYRRNHNLPTLRYCKYKFKKTKGKVIFYNNEIRRLTHQKIRELENKNGNEND